MITMKCWVKWHFISVLNNLVLKRAWWDFPGGPVAKTPTLSVQGAQVPTLLRELDSEGHN